MKFQGQSLEALVHGTVKIPRPGGKYLEFKVRATGLGDEAKGERLFPNPRPPIDFVYDKKGIMVRDPRTDKPMREANTFDADYNKRLEFVALMQMVVTAVDAITFDGGDVAWETTLTPGTAPYYEAVFEEMKRAGIVFGDIRLIVHRTKEIGNLDAKSLEKAAESFSEAGEPSA